MKDEHVFLAETYRDSPKVMTDEWRDSLVLVTAGLKVLDLNFDEGEFIRIVYDLP